MILFQGVTPRQKTTSQILLKIQLQNTPALGSALCRRTIHIHHYQAYQKKPRTISSPLLPQRLRVKNFFSLPLPDKTPPGTPLSRTYLVLKTFRLPNPNSTGRGEVCGDALGRPGNDNPLRWGEAENIIYR